MKQKHIKKGRIIRLKKWSVVVQPRVAFLCVVLVLAVFGLCVALIATGKYPVSFLDSLGTIFGHPPNETTQRVITTIRLPRVLAGLFTGLALGASGAIFQSISRNPLGSPDLVGFTTGAATGALVQIILLQGSPTAVALSAMIGGIVTGLIVYLLAMKNKTAGGYRIILTGIGVGITLAGVNTLLVVKGNLDRALAAQLWLAGSLDSRTWQDVWPAMSAVIIVLPVLLIIGNSLAQIEMGDNIAAALGVRVNRTRQIALLLAVIVAAAATATTGPIGFIALAAPQIVRRITKGNGVPVFTGALMGAFMLLLADYLSQILPVSKTLPVGRLTAVVGGVYLIWLLTRPQKKQ